MFKGVPYQPSGITVRTQSTSADISWEGDGCSTRYQFNNNIYTETMNL